MVVRARGLLVLSTFVVSVGFFALEGCTSHSATGNSCASSIQVDRFKELSVVDDGVVGDARASNTNDGPWSFRYAVENMVPTGTDPGTFIQQWFTEWVTTSTLNGYSLEPPPSEGTNPRAGPMNSLILCPWAQATASNGCNSDCSLCTVDPPTLDMANAPFRLISIVNRLDLGEQMGIGPNGEARLVFALTNGPADNSANQTMPMTMIFEYAVPDSVEKLQWAQSWHALGSMTAFDETFNAALQGITDTFVKRDASPGKQNGSAISQVRTDESALFWVWQLRQFELGDDGLMHLHTLRNAPDVSLNGSSQLATYVTQNAAAIKANYYLLPDSMLAGSDDENVFRWGLDGVDTATMNAFVTGTCSGCHAEGINQSIDVVFHTSPFRSGTAKLSPFVNNPADPQHDDLARRTDILSAALCGQ